MKRALIGGGGHAKEVMFQMGQTLPIFVDDKFFNGEKNTYKLSTLDPSEYEVMIAIGSPKLRRKIFENLPHGTKFFSFIHQSALVGDDVEIGEGSFIGAYSVITTNIKIGSQALLNRAVHVGHDSVIGNFFSAMPFSVVSGNCKIGDDVYIGTNSSIREKIVICNSVILGLNSGVIKDINEPGTYVGTPSKKISYYET